MDVQIVARTNASPTCPRREVGPLLTPTFSILEVEKGQFLPPLKPPLLAILGHGPANLRPTQTNPQKARGVRKFSIHFHVKMGKISLCNSFSNKLLGLERQLPLKIAPCARFSQFFPRFARFWADFRRYKPPLLTPTFASSEVIYPHLLTPTFAC